VYLKTLESQQSSIADSPQGQLDLSVQEPIDEPTDDLIRAAIDELDPDALSPREALAALYKLKEL